jgi:hypothetical protein
MELPSVKFIFQVTSCTDGIVHFITAQILDKGQVQPTQLSMTADAAIRIVLHSAEVVHFTHTIRLLIVWAHPRITMYATSSNRSLMFHRPILA